jgi:hypothetical protein
MRFRAGRARDAGMNDAAPRLQSEGDFRPAQKMAIVRRRILDNLQGLNMTKIRIEIDTESGFHELSRSLLPMAGQPSIVVVSPIKMRGTTLETNFSAGVASRATITIKDKLDYKHDDRSEMEKVIKTFSNANLIVTAGGTMAYEAAADKIDPDSSSPQRFFSILGPTPQPYHKKFKGGVTLGVISHKDRAQKIIEASNNQISANQIAYIYNANNDVYDDPKQLYQYNERDTWINNNTYATGNDTGGKNNENNFDLSGLPNTIKGIVISCDPFFQDHKDKLIAAVNTWIGADATKFVCYPFFAYKQGALKANQSMIYGPDLDDAYYTTGQLAGNYLQSSTELPVTIMPARNKYELIK